MSVCVCACVRVRVFDCVRERESECECVNITHIEIILSNLIFFTKYACQFSILV